MKKLPTFWLLLSISIAPLPLSKTNIDSQFREIDPSNLIEQHQKIVRPFKNLRNRLPSGKQPPQRPPISVRITPQDALCTAEKEYCKERKITVQHTLAQLACPISEKSTLTIAVCFSGGGFRSMFLSLGFLQGLEEAGLLDAVTYVASLSGSTWAVGSWIASGYTLSQQQQIFSSLFGHGLRPLKNPQDLATLATEMLHKALAGQFLSSIDIYGALLAHNLLTSLDKQKITISLSQAHQKLHPSCYPFPIYTAIMTNTQPYEWMEITPYEVGSSFLQAYIPTDAYGSFFTTGIATQGCAPLSLGYFFGIFGSAYAVSLQDIIHFSGENIASIKNMIPLSLYQILADSIKKLLGSSYHGARFLPSTLPNFTYHLSHSPLSSQRYLTLVDAGIDFNLPIPPLLRPGRNIDLIIIFDSSSEIDTYPALPLAQQYALRKNLSFPPITTAPSHPGLTIFGNPQQKCSGPVIAYLPRKCTTDNIKDDLSFDLETCIEKEWCHTLNFCYSAAQIEKLCGLARRAAKTHTPPLVALIKEIAKLK